jgi:hypothetical protein
MKQYYLLEGDSQIGPFTLDQLKTQKITSSTPIWFEGLSEWTTAANLSELKEILNAVPPPFKSKNTMKTSTKQRADKTGVYRMIYYLLVLLMLVIGVFTYDYIQKSNLQDHLDASAKAEEDQKASIRKSILDYLPIEASDYSVGVFGGINDLSISITNNTNYTIDQVLVKISYIKPDGATWQSVTEEFSLLSPNTIKTKRIADSERGTRVEYEIISVKSSDLGL